MTPHSSPEGCRHERRHVGWHPGMRCDDCGFRVYLQDDDTWGVWRDPDDPYAEFRPHSSPGMGAGVSPPTGVT